MGKYTKYQVSREEPAWDIHPIWRGIGCILLLLIPIMSYAGAVALIDSGTLTQYAKMPEEMMRTVLIPGANLNVPHLFANLLVTAILAVIGFGVMTILYAIVWRVFGPPRYGPLDSPPVRGRPRRRR